VRRREGDAGGALGPVVIFTEYEPLLASLAAGQNVAFELA